ncbi:hypothetical protein P43SY_010537 [Pythium insidiosum]|uniref:NmrA-like domain-containing protein n=1 Tax=Pythium insidiosum TaxID=114742 RepID=A0AAD5PZV1_PYTIN|nr:hypothetical protein P43SY_010537 [Pythium insidiosum]
MIRDSGVPTYTFLRNGLYFDNNVGSIHGALHSGKWYSAAKDGKTSAISRDDLALAAAHALVSSKAGSESKV